MTPAMSRWFRPLLLALLLAGGSLVAAPVTPVQAQEPLHPSEVFGFEPGADYELADYGQLQDYYRQLANASDRVRLTEIGTTTRDRPMLLLFISTPENLAQLDRWRSISQRLARARDLSDEEARSLADEGKAIVWIDSGLHSTEVAHAQHAPLLAHHMATDESAESQRIREDVILLLMPVMNPDGHEIVVDWYRENLGTPFETTRPPEVYHEYVGHDNNRDWFMLLQDESSNVARILYEEWYPQIVFNHHQTAPFPARIFIPPFADPVNPNIPAQVVRGVNLVGDAISQRMVRENLPGVVSRMTFDMWWNGGMRTAPYFHNQIGILSEVGHASATPRYHDPDDLPEFFGRGGDQIPATEPSVFYPDPWPGGWARLGDAVQYHFTSSLATLDVAQRMKEQWLHGIYQMGEEQIEAGESGGPFAYVVPMEQWDRYEAVEMLNVLRRGGVEVHRATSSFQAGGSTYPAGSYIIYAGQAFRAHVMDLLEPQVYPERRLFEGGPPEPPYDLAGWTLPIQMGVDVVRIDEPFSASAEEVAGRVSLPEGRVAGNASFGWALSPRSNASAIAVNRLQRAGETVHWAGEPFQTGGASFEAGSFLVEAGPETEDRVRSLARELGLSFQGVATRPDGDLYSLPRPRIGVYRSWVSNIPEGWMRWVFDTYEFPYETLRDEDLRSGDLSGYDVIVLPAQSPSSLLNGHAPSTMPSEYVGGVGVEGMAALKRYVEEGGSVVALDGATDVLIRQFGLPVRNAVEGVSQSRFFIPGSLIRIEANGEHPLAAGLRDEGAAYFVTRRGSQSRAFDLVEPAREGDHVAPSQPVDVVARWAGSDLLASGWALGEDDHLAGKPALVRVGVGDGEVVLIGFRATFRGQPRGTFQFVFNALHGSTLALPRAGEFVEQAAGGVR